MANFPRIFQPCFPKMSAPPPPPKIHARKSSAFLSKFTFSSLRWAKTRGLKKRMRACRNARFKNTSVSKWFLDLFQAMVDSVSARFKNARVEKMPLNICIQWNAGTACVSECVPKTLACQGLRVGPSKSRTPFLLSRRFSAYGGDQYFSSS